MVSRSTDVPNTRPLGESVDRPTMLTSWPTGEMGVSVRTHALKEYNQSIKRVPPQALTSLFAVAQVRDIVQDPNSYPVPDLAAPPSKGVPRTFVRGGRKFSNGFC